jgi:hypothetical protein
MPAVRTEIIPYIFYRDVPAALEWLARAFGFTEDMRTGTKPGGGMHGEMSLDGQRIMMGQGAKDWGMVSPRDATMATMGVFIYLDDVDAHHARPRRPVPRSCSLPATRATAAPTRRATSTATRGSSPRRRDDGSAAQWCRVGAE